ncbi:MULTISPECIES: Lrp/AsnC family transcriptional regulator [Bacillus cereus group]|uniref:Lrp/AsnC family transcriptional regulator n=1 Tax=Bacillus cereus group TaxID=86661 RepID=UPI000BEE19F0|nr:MULTISPECIES: Lrp/AsnC family transcriptional regulator [Bacillus cereus group]MEB8799657.1 Lrp/AsnC family transcriptional regulator [Bacillus cereus]MEB8811846.1 Lrp/AsnC family transcriptional regulator [Bacillus cereus]MEB8995760.1 Lrp/AsnC family transcriptional regulator [Bacillus cereus]MEB9182043.1 Lrp/AsnC family transcriptional regulator [Bacillus cereus]MEC3021100.1 Lrp/AsnC family transcriptional regulator [Bacillus cereus]
MLDDTDKKILRELSKNGRMSMKELGKKVHLTGQATSSRVIKLEENGVIEGYTIKLNKQKSGYPVHTFINIYTKDVQHQPFLSFIKTQHEYIINNFKISGEGCYLLECKFSSNEVLNQFLTQLNQHANYKLSIVIN